MVTVELNITSKNALGEIDFRFPHELHEVLTTTLILCNLPVNSVNLKHENNYCQYNHVAEREACIKLAKSVQKILDLLGGKSKVTALEIGLN